MLAPPCSAADLSCVAAAAAIALRSLSARLAESRSVLNGAARLDGGFSVSSWLTLLCQLVASCWKAVKTWASVYFADAWIAAPICCADAFSCASTGWYWVLNVAVGLGDELPPQPPNASASAPAAMIVFLTRPLFARGRGTPFGSIQPFD